MANNRQASQLLRKQYRELLRRQQTLPGVIATIALRHFKRSFQKEGFTDKGFKAWPQVQRRIPGHRNYNPKQQQNILVGKGSPGLGATLFIDKKGWREIKIASRGKKYAQYHNEGAGKLPQRQFMGHSSRLKANVTRTLKKNMDKIFKP